MSDVVPGQLVDGLLNLGQAPLLSHLQRGEVGVGSGTIPVTLKLKHTQCHSEAV